jgi:hypothetical protein
LCYFYYEQQNIQELLPGLLPETLEELAILCQSINGVIWPTKLKKLQLGYFNELLEAEVI